MGWTVPSALVGPEHTLLPRFQHTLPHTLPSGALMHGCGDPPPPRPGQVAAVSLPRPGACRPDGAGPRQMHQLCATTLPLPSEHGRQPLMHALDGWHSAGPMCQPIDDVLELRIQTRAPHASTPTPPPTHPHPPPPSPHTHTHTHTLPRLPAAAPACWTAQGRRALRTRLSPSSTSRIRMAACTGEGHARARGVL